MLLKEKLQLEIDIADAKTRLFSLLRKKWLDITLTDSEAIIRFILDHENAKKDFSEYKKEIIEYCENSNIILKTEEII